MRRVITAVGVALPGLALAGFGLAHPFSLAPSTAMHWWQLHVWLVPVFPLLAVSVWWLLRGESGVLAWGARIGAYGYACLYTALDVLAGIGAGLVIDREQSGSQAALDLLAVGDRFGRAGVACLIVASVLAAAVLIRRDGVRAVPGAVVLVAAGYPFLIGHIFSPVGVLAMLGYAVGAALLALAARPAVAAGREPVPVA